jgi:hypothetical protein
MNKNCRENIKRIKKNHFSYFIYDVVNIFKYIHESI